MKQVSALLDVLCPMHLVLDDAGHILHAGPAALKLRPAAPLPGRRFLAVFDFLRPRGITTMQALMAHQGQKLHLRLRDAPATVLKAVIVAAPQGGGAVVNLSFGISIQEAVRDYALTSADFAPTDQAIEMLYLIEAKSAAMAASRKLNLRLQGARLAAEEQALRDTLTGLKNRRAMDHVLAQLVENRSDFAIMHLDLDYFKTVNDTLGHAAGDHVLQHVARILVEETRAGDMVARVGGDEFVLAFEGLTDHSRLEAIALRIVARLQDPIRINERMCTVSASIGTVTTRGRAGVSAAQLLDDADVALYASKRGGRARHSFYTPGLRQEPPGTG